MRYARKRDTAEAGIVEALRAAGALVHQTQDWDLIVKYRGKLWMLEVKTPKVARDKRQKKQEAFCALWEVAYVRTPVQALMTIGAMTSPPLEPS
jgi:hypothetical protein